MPWYEVASKLLYVLLFCSLMGYYAKHQHGWSFWVGFSLIFVIQATFFVLSGGQILD